MGAVTFPLLCFHSCKKCQFGGDAIESQVEVVEARFPHISA